MTKKALQEIIDRQTARIEQLERQSKDDGERLIRSLSDNRELREENERAMDLIKAQMEQLGGTYQLIGSLYDTMASIKKVRA